MAAVVPLILALNSVLAFRMNPHRHRSCQTEHFSEGNYPVHRKQFPEFLALTHFPGDSDEKAVDGTQYDLGAQGLQPGDQ